MSRQKLKGQRLEENKLYHSEWMRRWRSENKERSRQISRDFYKKNCEERKAQARACRLKVKSDPVRLEVRREYARNRMRRAVGDPQFHMRKRLRTRICMALKYKGVIKMRKTTDLIGCSMADFRIYLESKFTDGMSWDNRNLWHIDHIKPCNSFDLLDPAQQRFCFHYTNLQPLWAEDNLAKGDRQ